MSLIIRKIQKKKKKPQSQTYIIYNNKFKMDRRLKYKSWHYKSPRGEHRQENFRYSIQQYFHLYVPRARDVKERINKWDYIKFKSFCTAKENSSKMKREPTIWENIFANSTLDKGLTSKIYRDHITQHQEDKKST